MSDGGAAPEREGPDRAQIVRDVIVFQGKLVIDGLRDLVLVPVSLVAAFIDLLDNSVAPGHHFYRVVRFGRRTERFIDLFGCGPEGKEERTYGLKDRGLDDLVERVEATLREGRLSSSARKQLEDLLERVRTEQKGDGDA